MRHPAQYPTDPTQRQRLHIAKKPTGRNGVSSASFCRQSSRPHQATRRVAGKARSVATGSPNTAGRLQDAPWPSCGIATSRPCLGANGDPTRRKGQGVMPGSVVSIHLTRPATMPSPGAASRPSDLPSAGGFYAGPTLVRSIRAPEVSGFYPRAAKAGDRPGFAIPKILSRRRRA